jgi:hypothetical protein
MLKVYSEGFCKKEGLHLMDSVWRNTFIRYSLLTGWEGRLSIFDEISDSRLQNGLSFCHDAIHQVQLRSFTFFSYAIRSSLTPPLGLFAPTPKPRSGLFVFGVKLLSPGLDGTSKHPHWYISTSSDSLKFTCSSSRKSAQWGLFQRKAVSPYIILIRG